MKIITKKQYKDILDCLSELQGILWDQTDNPSNKVNKEYQYFAKRKLSKTNRLLGELR